MEVYLLNIFIGTVLCVPHAITNVTVALMFNILYPRWESNPQAEATSFKPVVFASFTTGMVVDKVGFEPTDSRDFPRVFRQQNFLPILPPMRLFWCRYIGLFPIETTCWSYPLKKVKLLGASVT